VGQRVKVHINAVNGHGEGIGHIKEGDSDYIIYIPNVKNNEYVTAEIVQVHKTYIVGRKI